MADLRGSPRELSRAKGRDADGVEGLPPVYEPSAAQCPANPWVGVERRIVETMALSARRRDLRPLRFLPTSVRLPKM